MKTQDNTEMCYRRRNWST